MDDLSAATTTGGVDLTSQIGLVVGPARRLGDAVHHGLVGGAHVLGASVLLAHPAAALAGVALARGAVPFRLAGLLARRAGAAVVDGGVEQLAARAIAAPARQAADFGVAVPLGDQRRRHWRHWWDGVGAHWRRRRTGTH